MTKVKWQGGALLAPVPPTMVSCGSMDSPNVLTVAWTGIINTKPSMTYVSIRPERYSYNLIRDSGEFVINLTTSRLVRAADFCGVKSGRDTDKLAETGLTVGASSEVIAPLIRESPVNIECRVRQVIPLGTHDMFMADIVCVDIDSELIDNNGKLCLYKSDLCAYSHGSYYSLGKHIGDFGFSVRKKGRKNGCK